MSGHDFIGHVRVGIEWASLAIELLGVLVIIAGVIRVACTRGTFGFLRAGTRADAYEGHKHELGKTLLLGLEFLVAGDVVRTVALEPTLTNVGVLGMLVLIRTFLSWSLVVEIEGRWPWQPRPADGKTAPANRNGGES